MKNNTLTTEAANLKSLFDKLGDDGKKINRTAFAKENGVKGGSTMIYQHLNELKPISMEAAKAYSRGFGVSIDKISPRLAKELKDNKDYLYDDLSVDSSKSLNANTSIQDSNVYQSSSNNVSQESRVPIISWVQAGLWVESNVMDETWEMNAWAHTSAKVSESVFALVVEGDSMTCDLGGYTFPHGTILICDPEQECRVGSFVIAKDTSTQQTTFKRLDGDGFSHRLTALNKKYEPIPIDNGHIRIIAKVVEKVLSEKLP